MYFFFSSEVGANKEGDIRVGCFEQEVSVAEEGRLLVLFNRKIGVTSLNRTGGVTF